MHVVLFINQGCPVLVLGDRNAARISNRTPGWISALKNWVWTALIQKDQKHVVGVIF